jgi:hypothetical protein
MAIITGGLGSRENLPSDPILTADGDVLTRVEYIQTGFLDLKIDDVQYVALHAFRLNKECSLAYVYIVVDGTNVYKYIMFDNAGEIIHDYGNILESVYEQAFNDLDYHHEIHYPAHDMFPEYDSDGNCVKIVTLGSSAVYNASSVNIAVDILVSGSTLSVDGTYGYDRTGNHRYTTVTNIAPNFAVEYNDSYMEHDGYRISPCRFEHIMRWKYADGVLDVKYIEITGDRHINPYGKGCEIIVEDGDEYMYLGYYSNNDTDEDNLLAFKLDWDNESYEPISSTPLSVLLDTGLVVGTDIRNSSIVYVRKISEGKLLVNYTYQNIEYDNDFYEYDSGVYLLNYNKGIITYTGKSITKSEYVKSRLVDFYEYSFPGFYDENWDAFSMFIPFPYSDCDIRNGLLYMLLCCQSVNITDGEAETKTYSWSHAEIKYATKDGSEDIVLEYVDVRHTNELASNSGLFAYGNYISGNTMYNLEVYCGVNGATNLNEYFGITIFDIKNTRADFWCENTYLSKHNIPLGEPI